MTDEGFVVEKVLSANDLGLTGAHQAGSLIPKEPQILAFFPQLDPKEKNPRKVIYFNDDCGDRHRFCFIYYNSRLLGCGTRNEYRLTCMTGYMRACNLKVGDSLIFSRENGEYHVGYRRQAETDAPKEEDVIVLNGKWKVIQL